MPLYYLNNKTAIIYLFKMTLIYAAKPRSHYSETAKIDILFASSKHTRWLLRFSASNVKTKFWYSHITTTDSDFYAVKPICERIPFYRAMLCIRGNSHGPVSVRPSQVGVLLKRLNVGSHKQHNTIAQDFSFLTPKISAKFDRGHPLRGRRMQVGWVKIGDFRQITSYISKKGTR